MPAPLILASASPRRRDLLGGLGFVFEIVPSGIPEVPLPGEEPATFARRAALEKALDVATRRRRCWVLGADTVVVIDGRILGKPADAVEAREMLRCLSGRTHEVLTGVALVGPEGAPVANLIVRSSVEFRALSDKEITAYVSSGEPLDKAGAYAIQGGARHFVCRVTGSRSNVIGLPADEVCDLLRAAAGILGAPAGSADSDCQPAS